MIATKYMLLGRIAYPHLAHKYLYGSKDQDLVDSDPKARYETTIILDRDDPKTAEYIDAVQELMSSKFGKRAGSARSGIKEGNERENVSEGFADKVYLVAKSRKLPKYYTSACKPVSVEKVEDTFYPGSYANVLLRPYAYDAGGNKGVAHELLGLQFVMDGEELTSRPTVTASDFSDMSGFAADRAAAAMGA